MIQCKYNRQVISAKRLNYAFCRRGAACEDLAPALCWLMVRGGDLDGGRAPLHVAIVCASSEDSNTNVDRDCTNDVEMHQQSCSNWHRLVAEAQQRTPPYQAMPLLGPRSPAKIAEVTLMRPIHGNL